MAQIYFARCGSFLLRAQQGRLYYVQRRYSEAQEYLLKAHELGPEDAEVQFQLGVTYQVLGQLDVAERFFLRAAELAPGSATVHFALASLQHELGKLDVARINYENVLRLQPTFAEALSNLGSLLHQQGIYVEAEHRLRAAIASKPNLAMAHSNLADCLLRQGRLDEAEASCLNALNLFPDYPEALGNLGAVYSEQLRFDEAETCLRRALSIKPDYVQALHNLAGVLKNKKQYHQAFDICKQSIAQAPNTADSYITLGSICSESGDVSMAINAYQYAIQLNPKSAIAYQALGDILRYTPFLEEEIKAYVKAIEIDPLGHGLEASVGLAIRHYLQGDMEKLVSSLLASKSIGASQQLRLRPVKVYWNYLGLLLGWYQQTTGHLPKPRGLPLLHVIGESHSLGAHGVTTTLHGVERQCFSHWIPGCKMWHLARNGASRFRYAVEEIFSRLPVKSAVLMTIGEIDCRPNEGIWKAANGRDRDAYEMLKTTVDGYLEAVALMARKATVDEIAIQGIPAPRYSLDGERDPGDSESFLTMIRQVNILLKESTLDRGWSFVDAYSATVDNKGVSNLKWRACPNFCVNGFEINLVRVALRTE